MGHSDFHRLKSQLYAMRSEAAALIRKRDFAAALTIAQKLRMTSFGGVSVRERSSLEENAERQANGIENDVRDAERTPQAQQARRILEDLRGQ